jgi:hypothetical protein
MIVRRGNGDRPGIDRIDYGPTPVEGYSRAGVSGSLVVGVSGSRRDEKVREARETKGRAA